MGKYKFNQYSLFWVGFILAFGQDVSAQNPKKTFVNKGMMQVASNTLVATHFNFINRDSGNVFNDGEFQFYKNYNNDGLFTHSSNRTTGHTVFTGNQLQLISGTQLSKHFDVHFNNASSQYPFNLTSDMVIDGTADFSRGIIKTDSSTGQIVFANNSKQVNASDNSHVEGEVTKEGNTAFTYPIGKSGYYRFAAISAVDSEADSYLGEYYLRNSGLDHPHAHRTGVIEKINDAEYWSIRRGPGTEGSVILTLSWDERTTPEDLYGNEGRELHIVRWDERQNLWVDEGGIVDYASKTVTSPVKVDDLGIFTLGRVKSDLINDGDVVIYNGVTPDGDGKNDYFLIDNIQQFPHNTVTIFNRWGREVWTTQQYDSSGNVFKGYAQGVKTFKNGEKLPTGTYYYILEYLYERNGESRMIKKAGYLHLENN